MVFTLVSLKLILVNLIQMRRFPRCVVEIGNGTKNIPYIAYAEATDKVIIGKYCSFARGVILVVHPGHYPPKDKEDYRVSTYPLACVGGHGFLKKYYLPERRNFVKIGNDVFIGANVIVLPGVTIGDGAIVGAGAVVSADVPPYAIVAGVPAKIIRYRYSPERIMKLQRIAWWNWNEKEIHDNMDFFYGKVDEFIAKFYREDKK